MEAGKFDDDWLVEVQRVFPAATPQDIMRACQIGFDQISSVRKGRPVS